MAMGTVALVCLAIVSAAGAGQAPGAGAVAPSAKEFALHTVPDRLTDLASRLVAAEQAYPGFRPPEPERDARVVTVSIELKDGAARIIGRPLPSASADFGFDLEQAFSDPSIPDLWVIVTDRNGDELKYWIPIHNAGVVRMEIVAGTEPTITESREFPLGRAAVSVSLPFIPGAKVGVFSASGRPAGPLREVIATLAERWPGRLADPAATQP